MAHVYNSLDNICHYITEHDVSASECELQLPAHFLMGWHSCYWKALLPNETTFSSPVTDNPPFIIDVCKSSKIMINLEGAHRIFLGIVKDNTSLEELDFIGRLRDRFPEHEPRLITDQPGEQPRLSLSDVDKLVSSSVGGLSYRRCQFYKNVVYAPHRFARMHNCDQGVPNFTMGDSLGYFAADAEETLGMLSCRLLAHWLPKRHWLLDAI